MLCYEWLPSHRKLNIYKVGEKKVLILIVFVMAYIRFGSNNIHCLLINSLQHAMEMKDYSPFVGLIAGIPDPIQLLIVVSQQLLYFREPWLIRDLCNCLRAAVPFLNFKETKLISLPDACGIKLSFSMPLCVLGP